MAPEVQDKIAELKGIPTVEELNKQLKESTLVVTFNKLDGDERVMTCTKSYDIIPEENRPKTEKEPPKGNVTVWDINAKGWRSFKYDRVTKVQSSS
jgi:hypothetical protein